MQWRNSKTTEKRLLLIASAGGHWIQLSRCSPAFEGHNQTYATTFRGVRAPSGSNPVSWICDASKSRPLLLVLLFLQILWLVVKLRPHVIVSTGAAPGLIATCIGKIFGARTIWIDSLANSEKLSLSGKLAERFADLWLTQWSHLANSQTNLRYYGTVL